MQTQIADSSGDPPYTTSYSYNGTHLVGETNPLSSYGMLWSLDSLKRAQMLQDATCFTMASSITYQPTGALKQYQTGVTVSGQPVFRKYVYTLEGSLYSVSLETAAGVNVGVGFQYARDAAGNVTDRDSLHGSVVLDRTYAFDRLGQLTTDHASTSHQQTAAYYHGASGSQPAGARSSSSYANAYTSGTVSLTHTYLSATNRLSSMVRNSSYTISVAHDALGRRTSDNDSYFYGGNDDLRSYTYLPNGLLGTITARVPIESCSRLGCSRTMSLGTTTIAYDHRGLPFATTFKTEGSSTTRIIKLFHDEAGRLVAARWQNSGSTAYLQLSLLYLGSQPVAAVHEEKSSSGTTTTTRLWLASDEQGTIYQAMDATGTTYYLADFPAFRWRQLSNSTFPLFRTALPGQWILEETAAKAFDQSCFTSTTTCPKIVARPPIHQNRLRNYDPYTGRFLEPDPMDELNVGSRPEGWRFARNNPLMWADPSGAFSIAPSCYSTPEGYLYPARLVRYAMEALARVLECRDRAACRNSKKKDDFEEIAEAIRDLDIRCAFTPGKGCATLDQDKNGVGLPGLCLWRADWYPCAQYTGRGTWEIDAHAQIMIHEAIHLGLQQYDEYVLKDGSGPGTEADYEAGRARSKVADRSAEIWHNCDGVGACP